jgi:uncharacterized protein (TIGR02266 family)
MAAAGEKGRERRAHTRYPVKLDVNYRRGESYLYSRAENLSELGIFLVSEELHEVGTRLELRFAAPEGGEAIELTGEVVWVERGTGGRQSGLGIKFVDPDPLVKERIRSLIRTVAFLE